MYVGSHTLVPQNTNSIWKFATRSADRSAEPREKKASGQYRWESHFHASLALDSCQRCHFLLTKHKGGSDLQFVDKAGWVSSPVLTNKLLCRKRRGAFVVSTSCQNKKNSDFLGLVSFLKGKNYFFGTWKGRTEIDVYGASERKTKLNGPFWWIILPSRNLDENKTIRALHVWVLNTDRGLKQLPGLKKAKMVIYSISSKLNSPFGTIGKATADKITAKRVGKNSRFRFCVCEILNILTCVFLPHLEWKFIVIEISVTFLSFGCLYLGVLGFKRDQYFSTLDFCIFNLLRAPWFVCL